MDWARSGHVVGVAAIFGSGNICSEKTEERTNERSKERKKGDGCIGVMALNGHSEYEITPRRE